MHNLTNLSLFKQAAFINNTWQTTKSGEVITVVNPFNEQVLGQVPCLSADEVSEAVAYADDAQPKWAVMSAYERAMILHRWADLIEKHTDDLARIMTLEQGKPIQESRGEIAYANSFVRFFAEEGKRIYGDTIPALKSNLRYMVLKQPIGVCAAITPWNFPAAMITRKVAPALAAGCTILVKPATQTPFSALALATLALEAGLPEGVLQVVTGRADVVGAVLTGDERIKKLSFTGSTQVGAQLMAQCATTIKKLSMELGGNAPFIVFDDADIDDAVDGLMASKFRNAGQTCVCANRIFVQNTIKAEFTQRLIKRVAALKIGNGLEADTQISVLVNQAGLDKALALLNDALSQGARLLIGGDINAVAKLALNPTVLTDVTPKMAIYHEEIFAPIAPIYGFDDEEEVIGLANDSCFGLAAYFYTHDLARAWRMSEALEYGMVGQNTGLISNEVAPFGGVKQSGFGREGSKYGIDEYLATKYWCVNLGD